MSDRKRVIVLGATGSIGSACCDILRNNLDRFTVVALSAYSKKTALESLASEFNVSSSILVSRDGEAALHRMIEETDADILVNGIAGSPGLRSSQIALESGKDLALANKETIVMAGSLIKEIAKKNKANILPVDSEHFAVFALCNAHGQDSIAEIILTASGGPFRAWDTKAIYSATPEQALKHPTWSMGSKITIDSASLANKGLEVIEAVRLFDIEPSKVSVVVHPQSIVHSMIRTKDGLLYAQLSQPDMRYPLLAALNWPHTVTNHLEPFSFNVSQTLEFQPPRMKDFPLLALAYQAASNAGSYTIAYNAANECAVAAFLSRTIPFGALAEVTAEVLKHDWSYTPKSIDAVIEADAHVRTLTASILKGWHT